MAGKWAAVAAGCCVVAVLVGIGIFVFSEDDGTGGRRGERLGGSGMPGELRFEEGDVIVFLDRSASEQDRADLEATVGEMPQVRSYDYRDEQETAEEFGRLFEGNEGMLDRVEENPDLLPTSYRLVLDDPDPDAFAAVVDAMEELDGVLRAVPVPSQISLPDDL